MTWLLAACRWWAVLGACVVGGLVGGILRGATAAVPSLTQGQLAPVPVVAVVALVPPVVLIWGWSLLPLRALAGAVRPVGALLVAAVATTCAVFAGSAWLTGGSGSAWECGRDAVGLMGLTLLGQRFWGERGALMLPVGYLVAAFTLGRPSGGPVPAWWAWVLADGGTVASLVLALACFAGGLAVTPCLPRRAVAVA